MSRSLPGRLRAAALTAVALAGATAFVAGPAQAAPSSSASAAGNPYAPSHGHAYRRGAVPTRPALVKIKEYAAQHPAVAAASSNLVYGGGVDGIGVTTGAEKVYVVFYGSQWGTKGTDANGYTTLSGDASGLAPRVQALFKGLGTNSEKWSGVMTQYCEGVSSGATSCPSTNTSHVGYPTGGALAGVWVDGAAASPASATGHQLAVEAVSAASHFGNTTAASNRNAQYVIVSPHGTTPDGFNTSTGNFCAWHDWNGDTTLSGGSASSSVGDVAFTNLPYIPDAGTSCGKNFVNSGTAGNLDGVTMVGGHEYAETITDQNPAGGWTDSSGQENADKCAWISSGTGASANVAFSTGTFAMQSTWANDTSGCAMSHAIVTNPSGGGGGGGGGCTAAQLLGNPGFESGATVWSQTSGVISNSTSEPAHSGSWDAWLDGYGTSHTDTLSQSVTLPAGCTTYTFSFYLHVDTAETTTSTAYDKLTVTAGSTTLATYSNLNKGTGYVQRSFSLSGFAGSTVTLKFTGVEDSSLQTSFVVDDTAVNVS